MSLEKDERTQTDTERRHHMQPDWNDAEIKQKMPRNCQSHQKPGRGKEGSPAPSFRGGGTLLTPDSNIYPPV